MQEKRQNPKAKQVKGTSCVRAIDVAIACATHLCCLVRSHPATQTGQVSPAHTRCVPSFSSVRRTQDWETWDWVSVILPSKGRHLGSGNQFTPSINTSLRASFSATIVGLPACIEARVPAEQVGVLLGSAKGFSGNL